MVFCQILDYHSINFSCVVHNLSYFFVCLLLFWLSREVVVKTFLSRAAVIEKLTNHVETALHFRDASLMLVNISLYKQKLLAGNKLSINFLILFENHFVPASALS